MKFGVREICDVVLKAKANQKIGNKIFYKNEPVIYFDTLKTSSMEGAATTVYAQGGRGNSRLVAWEGERTITFTMEDALISPAGFMILSGAGLIEATDDDTIAVHAAETTDKVYVDKATPNTAYIITEQYLSDDDYADIYVMLMDNDEISSEPFLGTKCSTAPTEIYNDVEVKNADGTTYKKFAKLCEEAANDGKLIQITDITDTEDDVTGDQGYTPTTGITGFKNQSIVTVDYYTDKGKGAQQIDITPDKFGGNYYLEASTLFRDTNGVDMPAEFIIPNCKIQSNFTFTMASSGDPSTFTFTMDAFPDYTRFNKTKKVLAAIQIIGGKATSDVYRTNTPSTHKADANGVIY